MFGVNFGAPDIPPAVRRRFAERVKLPGFTRGQYARLVGVATDATERDLMLVQADNGRRKLHTVPRRMATGTDWYGIYVW